MPPDLNDSIIVFLNAACYPFDDVMHGLRTSWSPPPRAADTRAAQPGSCCSSHISTPKFAWETAEFV
jgi:hypothetical protein